MCSKCARPSAAVLRRQADRLIFGLVVAGALSLIAIRWWLSQVDLLDWARGWLP